MPTYEYLCLECGDTFELQATMAEKTKGLDEQCPNCEGTLTQQVYGGISVRTNSRNTPPPTGGCCPGGGCC